MAGESELSALAVESRRRLAELRRFANKVGGRRSREILKLLPHFFRNAPEAFILGYRAEDLWAILLSAYQVMAASRGEKMSLSVFNPDPRRNGFSTDRTVVQISAPDAPFYVISVRERLRMLGHTVVHLIHPVLPVAWDGRGRLTELGDAKLPRRQSLIHIEIDRVEDASALDRIEHEIRDVFADIGMAVGDFERMRLTISSVRRELDGAKKNSPQYPDIRQLSQFLSWIDSGNFVFLGYREYDIFFRRGQRYYALRSGSGLGILRPPGRSRFTKPVAWSRLPEDIRMGLASDLPCVITQTNRLSPVYRRERMLYIGVKQFDARGRLCGERRWIGLLTNRVEGLPPQEIPILREKFERLVALEGAEPDSHQYREIYGIFSSYPKDFLFGARIEELRSEIRAAMAAQSSRDFKATFRPSRFGNEISVVVIMSRDKFSRDVRLRIEDHLRRRLDSSRIDTTLSMGAEGEEFARLYFSCLTRRKVPAQGTFQDLEKELAELAKSWTDRLQEELVRQQGPRAGTRLFQQYSGAFSVEFHAHTTPFGAVHDVSKLESLYAAAQPQSGAGSVQIDLFNSRRTPDCSNIKLYHLNSKLPLSDVMPVLTDHGLRVVDEVSNSVRVPGRSVAFIHTFRLQKDGVALEVDRIGPALTESVIGSLTGQMESDPLCALIVFSGLTAREVSLLRLYRNFLHQIVPVHTLRSIDTTLVKNPGGARILVDLFSERFDPTLGPAESPARRKSMAELAAAFRDFLDGVDDMVEDKILRLLANAIESTVRTNYFRSPLRRAIGVKIRSASLHTAPRPVPMFEIFVGDPDFEGVHLRGGRIARGGIRHSDRRDDFRTEILGLMKTQMVKNSIIVPVGAKGGFVVKKIVPREKSRAFAIECYRSFIRTLLDITDNRIGSRIVPPMSCVMYDEADPYLVVAADKGTADFSDIANAISLEAGFWLGDAFASGGKDGYDHKKYGITARGTWECVRHHLAMTGPKKTETIDLPVTCVGIGDMSGDVFGNGMIAAEDMRVSRRRVSIRLLAAFNHQYIFIDPNPDLKKSQTERLRLFHMSRSNWSDYDSAAISRGGGVFPRASKKISLSPEAARMIGIQGKFASGEEVVRGILRMKVDLLYNGGIGTYVKSSSERHADVSDPSNDFVRVDASHLGCAIVGEGGNVGFTQAARIEFAKMGGKINTDAVDNSAGVDLSDHEVNLKILLETMRVRGARRNRLLRSLARPVCAAVLRDNILQSRLLTVEEWRSRRDIEYFPHLIHALSSAAGLSRELEGLPSDKDLAERARTPAGLLRPELAVMASYVKIAVNRALEESVASGDSASLADDSIFGLFLHQYFPESVSRIYGSRLRQHRLAGQITASAAANAFVNRAGLTAAFRVGEEFHAQIPDVVKSYFVADRLFCAENIREKIWAEGERIVRSGDRSCPAAVEALMFLEDILLSVTRWLLKEFENADAGHALEKFSDIPKNLARAESLLSAVEHRNFIECRDRFRSAGFRPETSVRLASAGLGARLLEWQIAGRRLARLR